MRPAGCSILLAITLCMQRQRKRFTWAHDSLDPTLVRTTKSSCSSAAPAPQIHTVDGDVEEDVAIISTCSFPIKLTALCWQRT